MDESTMSPAERPFRDLLDRKSEFYRRVGRAEGCLGEGRRLVFLQGTRRFGQPDAATLAEIDAIHSVDHVEAVALRIVDPDVRTWDDLFQPFSSREPIGPHLRSESTDSPNHNTDAFRRPDPYNARSDRDPRG